jgi:RNase H-like domain found in reverse transcriptase
VNNVYVGLKGLIMQACLNDLAVGSDTPKQHVVDVLRVLEHTRDANLRLKLAKCTVGKTEVELLGHKVRFGEVRPNDRHQDCLQSFEKPSNVNELLRFLGLLQFFGAHVDYLAELAAPLYAILEGTLWNKRKRKREIIRLADWEQQWGKAQKESFEKLRNVLADPLFLVPARANAKNRLCTDASKYGLGAALLQWEEERGWLPMGFASRKLKGKSHATEQRIMKILQSCLVYGSSFIAYTGKSSRSSRITSH